MRTSTLQTEKRPRLAITVIKFHLYKHSVNSGVQQLLICKAGGADFILSSQSRYFAEPLSQTVQLVYRPTLIYDFVISLF